MGSKFIETKWHWGERCFAEGGEHQSGDFSFRFLCFFLLFFFFFFLDLVEEDFVEGAFESRFLVAAMSASLTFRFLRLRCSKLSSSSDELLDDDEDDDEEGDDDLRRFFFAFDVDVDAVLSARRRSRFFLSSSWNFWFMWSSQAASVLEPCFFFSMIRFTSSQVGLLRLR